MADYVYDKNDGMLHTRYSEIVHCRTDYAAMELAKQKLGLKRKIPPTKPMRFGTMMHEIWAEETAKTGLTPLCFNDELGFKESVLQFEVQQATTIFEGVVYHFTIDAVTMAGEIIDYKTGTEGTGWKDYYGSLQLPTYALLIRPHGLTPTHGHYLCQLWDKKRQEITSYHHVETDIMLGQLASAKAMLRQNTQRLINAMEHLAKT